jgi:hypothetical protein
MRLRSLWRLFPVAAVGACLATIPRAIAGSPDVLASRYDDGRTGAALAERLLLPDAIDSTADQNRFGALFDYDLSLRGAPAGDVYAQPLYVSNVGVPGHGTVDLLILAGTNGYVYAFDADGPQPGSDGILWQVDLGPAPDISDVWRNCSITHWCIGGGSNIRGPVGIMSTPVIDRARGIVFVVAHVLLDPDHVAYRLHALDLRDGHDLDGSSIDIGAQALGVTFDPNYQNQRVGLALANGQLIVAFGSYADLLPYHGWVLSYRYDGSTFGQTGALVTTPDGDTSSTCALEVPGSDPPENRCAHGGIWMTGRAPAVTADGNVMLMVGNGKNDLSASTARNFGNSLLMLDPVSLAVLDFYTPANHLVLNAADLDFGGSGPMIIPKSNIVLGGGKEGVMHVWDLTHLGKFSSNDAAVLQKFNAGTPMLHADTGNDMPGGAVIGGIIISQHPGHIMGGPVLWPRVLEDGGPLLLNWSENSELRNYRVDTTTAEPVTLPAAATGADFQAGHPGGILTLSASGADAHTGVVWASTYDASGTYSLGQGLTGALNAVRPGTLRAYAADTLQTLWNSDMNSARDGRYDFAKFNPPTVANGRVYLATFSNRVKVYGLLQHGYPRPAAKIVAIAAMPMLADDD